MPLQDFAAGAPGEKRLYFAAQFGIHAVEQRRALLAGALASRVVELFNLLEALRGHVLSAALFYSLTLAIAKPWQDPNRA